TARFVEEVIDEVIRTKPVRAHFTFTQGLAAQGGLGLAAAARAADFYRLQLEAA
ncbi:MAG TPA: phage tail protein I, partial [Brevundimonas sp.]|nr:phage tail protein I [Brevundimonas sp.]